MSGFDPVLVFDIETVPDTAGARRLLEIDAEVPDAEVLALMQARRRAERGVDFQPPHLHRVVAIAATLRSGDDSFKCWSLGDPDESEGQLIQRFFDGIERYRPQLVSWNGSGFDLPVLHYRALIHGLHAPTYWDTGQRTREAKFNNYISRYHEQHLDLMDLLALYNGRNYAPLTELAQLLGFPGKLGMDGSKVAAAYADGQIEAIRQYCETDVMNTYLVYLRFQRLRGALDAKTEVAEHTRVREFLEATPAPHWQEFAAAWAAA